MPCCCAGFLLAGEFRADDNPYGTKRKLAIAGKKLEIKILMLSSDQEFLSQVTDAVEDRYVLFHAKNLKQALGFDQLGQVALLIADSELLTGEPAPVLERLSRRAPGMVPVIAGTAREKPLLQKMMSEGKIFRVLTKPCQPGQTRLYIEAAVKQAMQMRGVDHIVEKSSGRSWKKPVLIVGSIAAVLMSVLRSGDNQLSEEAGKIRPDVRRIKQLRIRSDPEFDRRRRPRRQTHPTRSRQMDTGCESQFQRQGPTRHEL